MNQVAPLPHELTNEENDNNTEEEPTPASLSAVALTQEIANQTISNRTEYIFGLERSLECLRARVDDDDGNVDAAALIALHQQLIDDAKRAIDAVMEDMMRLEHD
jgi:hypothetical protein